MFAPLEKMFGGKKQKEKREQIKNKKKSKLILLSTWGDFGTTCDVNGVAVDAYGLILCQNEAYHFQKGFLMPIC